MSEFSLGLYIPRIKTESISEHQVKKVSSCFLNEKEEKCMEDLPKIYQLKRESMASWCLPAHVAS